MENKKLILAGVFVVLFSNIPLYSSVIGYHQSQPQVSAGVEAADSTTYLLVNTNVDVFYGDATNVNPFRNQQPEVVRTLPVRVSVSGHRTIRQIVSIEAFNGDEWVPVRHDHRIRRGWVTIRYIHEDGSREVWFLNSDTYT